jgi:hypothetical protein
MLSKGLAPGGPPPPRGVARGWFLRRARPLHAGLGHRRDRGPASGGCCCYCSRGRRGHALGLSPAPYAWGLSHLGSLGRLGPFSGLSVLQRVAYFFGGA